MDNTAQETRLNIAHLDSTAALLTANSIPFTTGEESLRCEFSLAGQTYAIVHIVPAESVFPEVLDRDKFLDSFASIQERVLASDFQGSKRKDQYLLMVGSAEFLEQPTNLRATSIVEMDLSYGKKEVMTPELVVDWLTSPFMKVPGSMRANATPIAAAVADLRGKSQPVANVVFNPEATLHGPEEHRYVVQQATASVFRRIMGGDFKVFWDQGIPSLGRTPDKEGLDLAFASSGERIAFAYALFLGRSMMDVTPGMCVGINGSFDRLDSVRQIGCYDCLREFVAATGANVVVQSAKESLRQLFLYRMRAVVTALGGSVTDYPYSPYLNQ